MAELTQSDLAGLASQLLGGEPLLRQSSHAPAAHTAPAKKDRVAAADGYFETADAQRQRVQSEIAGGSGQTQHHAAHDRGTPDLLRFGNNDLNDPLKVMAEIQRQAGTTPTAHMTVAHSTSFETGASGPADPKRTVKPTLGF